MSQRNADHMTELCYPDRMMADEFANEVREGLSPFVDNMSHLGVRLRYAEEWMENFAAWMEMQRPGPPEGKCANHQG